jgi:hypothetical protein
MDRPTDLSHSGRVLIFALTAVDKNGRATEPTVLVRNRRMIKRIEEQIP